MPTNPFINRILLICGAAAMAAAALGCSYGRVTDTESGATVPGAYVMFKAPVFNTATGGTPIVTSTAYQNVYAWNPAAPGANGASGSYYLNPFGTLNPGDTKETYVPEGWQRIYVSAPGYDPRVFFRNHLYTSCNTYGNKNPYSSGPYPYDVSGSPTNSVTCSLEQLKLSPSGVNYIKDPDLIVDPRTLLDNAFSEVRGAPLPEGELVSHNDCEGKYNRCVRVAVGTPNVGAGDLWVTSTHPTPTTIGPIVQRRYLRNGNASNTNNTTINAAFVSDGHPHLHFLNWTAIRMRKITSACDTEAKATACPPIPSTGGKRSFCLTDTNKFDSSTVAGVYRPNQTYGCTDDGRSISQGISSGGEDVYGKHLSGQLVSAEGLHGQFWLEVEVNPADGSGKRPVLESDYSNNVARVKITIP